jgi:hypothetical protein
MTLNKCPFLLIQWLEKHSFSAKMVNCQIIITFTCRLRQTLISHFEIKVRIIQIIVYIEDVKYIIKLA